MIISKKEYNDLKSTLERRNDMLFTQRGIYEDRIKKYQEDIAEYRRKLRKIHKLITDQRQRQNYKSVENALNRIETEINKIETGE